jgi:hypothetical protein
MHLRTESLAAQILAQVNDTASTWPGPLNGLATNVKMRNEREGERFRGKIVGAETAGDEPAEEHSREFGAKELHTSHPAGRATTCPHHSPCANVFNESNDQCQAILLLI